MTIKKVNFFAGSDTVFNKRYYEQYDPVNPAFYGTGTVNVNDVDNSNKRG